MEDQRVVQEGLRLKQFRKHKGISQKELAGILKCSQPNLSKIESCELGISSSLRELLFREYPDLNPSWLFTGTGEMLTEVYDQSYISELLNQEKNAGYKDADDYFARFEILIKEGKVPNSVIASIFSDMRNLIKLQQDTLGELKKSQEDLRKSIETNAKLIDKLLG
jgi:transcriptional regulator with XRE-family HTH domain